jgi:hypothetical protein
MELADLRIVPLNSKKRPAEMQAFFLCLFERVSEKKRGSQHPPMSAAPGGADHAPHKGRGTEIRVVYMDGLSC